MKSPREGDSRTRRRRRAARVCGGEGWVGGEGVEERWRREIRESKGREDAAAATAAAGEEEEDLNDRTMDMTRGCIFLCLYFLPALLLSLLFRSVISIDLWPPRNGREAAMNGAFFFCPH